MARIDQGAVTLFTKNGYDWTRRMPVLPNELLMLPVRSAWIDGEVVMQTDLINADPSPRTWTSDWDAQGIGNLSFEWWPVWSTTRTIGLLTFVETDVRSWLISTLNSSKASCGDRSMRNRMTLHRRVNAGDLSIQIAYARDQINMVST